jgi:hypothetical protein
MYERRDEVPCKEELTRDLDDVSRDDVLGADLLDAGLVGANDLAHLGLVLLQGFNRRFSIALLAFKDGEDE